MFSSAPSNEIYKSIDVPEDGLSVREEIWLDLEVRPLFVAKRMRSMHLPVDGLSAADGRFVVLASYGMSFE